MCDILEGGNSKGGGSLIEWDFILDIGESVYLLIFSEGNTSYSSKSSLLQK